MGDDFDGVVVFFLIGLGILVFGLGVDLMVDLFGLGCCCICFRLVVFFNINLLFCSVVLIF